MTRLVLAFAMMLAPVAASAVPDQMLRQIDWRLARYHIRADVTQLTNAQATAIWFELTSEPERRTGDWSRKRQRILNIIRKGEEF